jgi:uncharacterized RDD family membrane protein YckC
MIQTFFLGEATMSEDGNELSDANAYAAPTTTKANVSTANQSLFRQGLGRVGAFNLDYAIIAFGGQILGTFVGGVLGASASDELDMGMMAMLGSFMGMIAGPAVLALLFLLGEAFTGRSLGKEIAGCRIYSADGTPASGGQLMTRALFKWSPFVISVIAIFIPSGIIGILFILSVLFLLISGVTIFGKSKQMLYDKIAGTAVYELE